MKNASRNIVYENGHHRVSIAEWGQPQTNYTVNDHPIVMAYIMGKTPDHTMNLYHLLRKLKVTR